MAKQAPSLTEAVQQFLYTHAPQMHYKKELVSLIVDWEMAYQARIAELEGKVNSQASSRMISEGGPDDNRGNRYGGFID